MVFVATTRIEIIGNPEKKKLDFEAEEIGRRRSSGGKLEKSCTGIGFGFHFGPVRKLGVEKAGGGVPPVYGARKIRTCSTPSTSSSSIVII